MNRLFVFWLSLSLSGTLVSLVLILLRPLLQRFGKTWQYYLWLLVVLRLLIPYSPEISIVGGMFQQIQAQLAVLDEPMKQSQEVTFLEGEGAQSPAVLQIGDTNPQESSVTDSIFGLRPHIWGAFWLSVAVFLFIRKIVGYVKFLMAVKRESKIIPDGKLPAVLQEVSTTMGMKKKIDVSTNSLVQAPMLVGFIRPIIVLPKEDIPDDQLKFILKHELIHARRMDIVYKWIAEIAVCLHWFNPFAHWVRNQISQDCEFSCDEAVVSGLAIQERKIYGETLLNSIVINGLGSSNIVSLSLNKEGKLIKERLGAIMQYHRKPKWVVFLAAFLTSVLFCGTVFAGTNTVVAMENIQTDYTISPIQISDKEIAPGGKITLGSQSLVSGMECQILLTWTGNDKLTVKCSSADGVTKTITIKSQKATTFEIEDSGEYTITVKNHNPYKISNVGGTISFKQDNENTRLQNSDIPAVLSSQTRQTVTYKDVDIRYYDEGQPYVHDVKINNTDKLIVSSERGMTAFDKDGNPLKIRWNGLDSDSKPAYFFLYDWGTEEIQPYQTEDLFGGWSLIESGTDSNIAKIAYVLYCDKKITFEDGTVWENPNFNSWQSTYEGQKTDVNILKNYYPYEQKITTSGALQITAGPEPE